MIARVLLVSLTAFLTIPIARAEDGEGLLAVRATPFAAVSVDGTLKGTTPFKPFPLPSGSHRIDLSSAGTGARQTMTVRIRPGETTLIKADLTAPSPGQDLTRDPSFYREACADGDAFGCAALGILYGLGQGVPKDLAQRDAFARRACELDSHCGRLGL
jgi:hypothetical protein